MGIEDTPITRAIQVNTWLQFCGYEAFFVENYHEKCRKLELIFLIFCSFSFFSVFRQVSEPIMTCLLFCEHLGTVLAEKNFCLDIRAFVILKNINFFSFLVKVVCKSLFVHDLASIIFKKSHKWF